MPTYEYQCEKCGEGFELFQSMKDDPIKDCPNEACGGKGTVKRLIGSGAGVIFKGSGFYQTDYKGSNPSSGGEKASESSKSDSGKPSGGGCCSGCNCSAH